MDIDNLFKPVDGGSGKGKRKAKAPSLESLKKGNYGVLNTASEMESNSPKRTKIEDASEDYYENTVGYEDDIDDEGGRFYDDGLSAKQKTVLDWVDEAEDVEKIDAISIKKHLLRLEKCVSKNTEQRLKYENNPEQFVESEADLDEAIQQLVVMSSDVKVSIPVFLSLDATQTLVSLLNHENMDIVLDVVQVVSELTADDMWSSEEQDEEERKAIKDFLDSLASHSFFDFLGEALKRLNETAEGDIGDSDKEGVNAILTLVENIISFDPSYSAKAVKGMNLIDWLLCRIQKPLRSGNDTTETGRVDSNQQYSAEILSIILQSSKDLHGTLVGAKPPAGSKGKISQSGVDVLLQCLARYRKSDPEDDQEEEYMESLFDCLCSLLSNYSAKVAFLEAEGVELVILMAKERRIGRARAFKVLNHALTTADSGLSGEFLEQEKTVEEKIAARFIESKGLGPLIGAFMKKGTKTLSKNYKSYSESEEEEHIIGCLSLLFQLTDPGTPLRWLILAKFVPPDSKANEHSSTRDKSKDHIDRLLELSTYFTTRVETAEKQLQEEHANDSDGDDYELDPDELYLKKLDAGLFSLQMIDATIANIVLEDQNAASHIRRVLSRHGRSLNDIKSTVKDLTETLYASSNAGAIATQDNNADEKSGNNGELEQKTLSRSKRRIDNLLLAIASL